MALAKGLFDCTGKVTLVTGGNGGIGLGFAMGVARMGGNLAIWARNGDKNAVAKAQLLEAGAARVETYHVDVATEQAIVTGYAQVMQDFGRIDCVFANSGAAPHYNSVFDMPTEHWRQFQEVALHGAFFTLREGARHMVKRAEAGEPGGSLIFCGSLSMFKGLAGKVAYAGSKAALGAMIRSMAVEFGKYGIRANSIAPGYIKTGMTGDGELSQVDKYFAAKNPIPRPGYPADFEGIAAYLASDASSFHSGDTIIIDGACMVNL
jgi:NAD(P)-dependent dehydrogenase (short-subunit alcohol dehydrogenase family)